MKNFKLLIAACSMAAIGLISFKTKPVLTNETPYFNNTNALTDNEAYYSATDLTQDSTRQDTTRRRRRDTTRKRPTDTTRKPPTDTTRLNIQ